MRRGRFRPRKIVSRCGLPDWERTACTLDKSVRGTLWDRNIGAESLTSRYILPRNCRTKVLVLDCFIPGGIRMRTRWGRWSRLGLAGGLVGMLLTSSAASAQDVDRVAPAIAGTIL